MVVLYIVDPTVLLLAVSKQIRTVQAGCGRLCQLDSISK